MDRPNLLGRLGGVNPKIKSWQYSISALSFYVNAQCIYSQIAISLRSNMYYKVGTWLSSTPCAEQ